VTTYVDSSALLKRYVDEPDRDRAEEFLTADPVLVTGRHTVVEVRRNLARLLDGRELERTRSLFLDDVGRLALVELDSRTIELAATAAELTGARTLDALHLGAAQRLGTSTPLLTFDVRLGRAARELGFTVLGE
jgi:predicted nucleic acid-binding protein